MGRLLKIFQPAPRRSAARNLIITLGQTTLFWLAFIAAGPLLIRQLDPWRFSYAGQGAVAVVLGVLFAFLNLWSGVTMATVGQGTPFPTQTARELVVAGPYRFIRNPMALGGLGVGFAVGVWMGSPLTLLYAVLGGVLWHVVARPPEEADLHQRFGESYDAYRKDVRCWIPRVRRS